MLYMETVVSVSAAVDVVSCTTNKKYVTNNPSSCKTTLSLNIWLVGQAVIHKCAKLASKHTLIIYDMRILLFESFIACFSKCSTVVLTLL